MRKFLIVWGIVTVLLAVLFALLVYPVPANAAAARPAPPGAGYEWGIATSALSATCSYPDAGGWDRRNYRSLTGRGYNGAAGAGVTVWPTSLVISEPCFATSGAGNLQTRLKLAWKLGGVSVSSSSENALGSLTLGGHSSGSPAPAVNQKVYCSTTEWTKTSSLTVRSGSTAVGPTNFGGYPGNVFYTNGGPVVNSTGSPYWEGSTTGCTYITKIEVSVCSWPTNSVGSANCLIARWTAERVFSGATYTESIDDWNPVRDVCQLYAEHPDCVYELPSDDIDGTDFNTVCAYAPEFAWGDWNWLKDFVGHYARCLFEPVNGWDEPGLIEEAWELGGLYEAGDLVSTLISSVTFYEGCGTLVDIALEFDFMGHHDLGDIYVNTCSYATDVALAKTIMRATIWVMFGVSLVGFLIAVLRSFVDRSMPKIWYVMDDGSDS